MDKLYQRINYENSPSKKTPLSEANLNKMDKALDDLDNRIIEQDAAFAKSIEEEGKKIEEVNGKVSALTDTAATLTQSTADAITVEKSGTTIVATDSSDKGFEQFKTYGKSVQEKTSGKNLLKNTAVSRTINGVTFTVNEDGSVTANGTSTAVTLCLLGEASLTVGISYIISGCPSGGSDTTYRLDLRTADGAYKTQETGSGLPYTADDDIVTLYARIGSGVTVSNIVFNPMIRLASIEDDTYEPYTGSIPSPNPEYPQPIVSAGQKLENGIVSDVGISKKLTGKNLAWPYLTESISTYGVTFTVDDSGTIVMDGTTTGELWIEVFRANLKAGKTYTLSCDSRLRVHVWDAEELIRLKPTGEPGGTFLALRDGLHHIFINNFANESFNNVKINLQIEEGTVETDYEPYTEQTLTLNRVLRGIPVTDASLANYTDENGQMWCADEIDVERGVLVQRVGTILPTEWALHNVYSITSGYRFMARINGTANGVTKTVRYIPCVCSHYSFKKTSSYSTQGDYITTDEAHEQGRIYIRTTNEELSSTAKFTEWATAENMIVNYILATPIETPLTDEEIAAYKALHTYKPTTVITNDAGCYMEVEYVADTKNHIAQNYVPVSKYAALEERVSALEQLHV